MQTAPPAVSTAPTGAPLGSQVASTLFGNLSKIIRGKPTELRLIIATLLSGGHILVEDVPGVGKTLLAKSLAASIGGTFRRVQGTPDLLPADLTGVAIYRRSTESWHFRPGPLFANVVIVDEINRATPRTQAALLEAMEERQVSVDGTTHALPDPFFLIATQNPFEHAGTFPLVEGQLDRFSAIFEMGLPDRQTERGLLMGDGGAGQLANLQSVVTAETLAQAIQEVRSLHCSESVANYILDIVTATRQHPEISLGASPRASLGMLAVARGHATTVGLGFVTPDDVKAVASAVLSHRIILSGGTNVPAARAIMDDLLRSVPVPRA